MDDLFVKRRDFKQYLNEVKGDPNAFGEYFGASVSALDINNDGFDDLVVGAPLYSNDSFIEVGRVYVFLMMIQEVSVHQFWRHFLVVLLKIRANIWN